MTNNTPSGAKKHCESTEFEPKSRQTAKMFSFFFFFFFRRASSNLCDSLTMIFSHNIFHWPVHQPIAFPRFEVTRGNYNRSLKNYGFLYDAIFFVIYVRMRTNHLATKCNYYARNTVGVRGAFEESLSFFSQYCIGSLWGETCCSVINGKLQLKHASVCS